MKIIIPMAGKGKRMRPHTLTVPKPLIPIVGKPIVKHLVEEIYKVVSVKIDEIAFVIGDFGVEVENELLKIAENYGAKGTIYYQNEPLGTAHAVNCAKNSLNGPVIVAFADTIFNADFTVDENIDAAIWVKKVDDPSAFGVVKVNENEIITDFIEKPKKFISDLAIIGIYYFKQGEELADEIKYLIDNKIMVNNEYQLTDALENMKNKGIQFKSKKVNEWLDCGNKNATIHANTRMLEILKPQNSIDDNKQITRSRIIEPCYVGKNVTINNSIIGPNVSIGDNTKIDSCIIQNSILQQNTVLNTLTLKNSMIGNYVNYSKNFDELSIGDYTTMN